MRDFLLWLSIFVGCYGKFIKSRCHADVDPTQVGRCLRPLLDKWEAVKEIESHATQLHFPIIFYTKQSLLDLCLIYSEIEEDCLMLELGKKCTGDELIMYANLHFRFWCGPTAPIALPNFMCISGSVLKARHCQRYLMGMSSMGKLEEECKGVADFYDCAAPFVEKDCGQEARSIFTISIVSHGCLLPNVNFEKDMELLREINSTEKLTMKKAKEFIKNEMIVNVEESENEKNDPNANCTEAMSDKAINCLLPITDKIQDFSLANPVPIGLPLFNVSGDEIYSLCQEYEEVNKNCITKEIQENCAALRIVTFADEILGVTCGEMKEQPKFTKRIDCIWRQVLKNPPCLSLVQGEIDPIATTSAKCQGMPEFLDCVMKDVIHCGNAAFEFLIEMVDGFGCPLKELDENIWENSSIFEKVVSSTTSADEEFPTLRSNETINSSNLSSDVASIDQNFAPIMSEIVETTTLENVDFQMDSNEDRNYEDISKENPGNNEYEEEKDRFKGIKFKDEEIPVPPSFEAKSTERFLATNGLENVELDMQPVTIFNPNCTEEARNRSRTCIAPLMKTWIEIREQRPELEDITFPLFKYTRTELLELCDGYANTFLCAGFESIESCLNDQLVRFAQDHLGYICSPNNIGNFLRHYDCILEIEMATPECREFIKGTLRNDAHKCGGINAYRSCLKARLLKQCTREAMQEFDQSVLQFGCSI